MKLPNTSNHKGFTLIEVIVVVCLLSVIAALGLLISMDFYRGNSFRSERDILVSILQKARSQAMNNINNSRHGVYISPNSYVIFEGNSYNPADSKNIVVNASSSISNSGPITVLFEQISGDVLAANSGELEITLSSASQTESLRINKEGRINW